MRWCCPRLGWLRPVVALAGATGPAACVLQGRAVQPHSVHHAAGCSPPGRRPHTRGFPRPSASARFQFITQSSVVPTVPFFALAPWVQGSCGVVAHSRVINGTAFWGCALTGFARHRAGVHPVDATPAAQRVRAGGSRRFRGSSVRWGCGPSMRFVGETPALLKWSGVAAVWRRLAGYPLVAQSHNAFDHSLKSRAGSQICAKRRGACRIHNPREQDV